MTKNDFNVTLTGPEIDLGAATEQEKQESLGGFDPYATEPETSPIYTQPDKKVGPLERIRLESEKRTGVETTIPRALGRLVGSVLFGGDERKVEQKNALTDLAKGEWLADDWSKLGPMAPGTPGGVTAVPKIRVDFRTATPQQIEGMVKFAGLDSDQIGRFFEERMAWEKANGETRDPRDVLADVVSAEAENTLRQRVHVSSRAAAALPEGGKNEKGFGYSFLGGGLMSLPYMGTYALSYATRMGPTLPLLASYDRRLQANREDQLGFTEEGDLGVVKPGMAPEEAERKAMIGAVKETAIEIAGGKVVGAIAKPLAKLAGSVASRIMPKTVDAISKFSQDVIRNNPSLRKFVEFWNTASEITQVQKYPEETLEEYVDYVSDDIFKLTPDAPEGNIRDRFIAANKKFGGQLGDILLTLAFIQGPQAITAGAETVGYAQKEKAAERSAAEWLKVAGVSDEQAKEILADGDARAAVEYVVADETRRKEIAKRVSDRSARIADDLLKTNEWMEDGGGKNAVSRFVPPTPADLVPGEDGIARYESSGVGIEYDAPNSRIAVTDTRTGRQAFVFGGQTPAEGMEQAFAIADSFDREAQGRDAVNAKKRELLAKALEARGVDGTYVFVEKPEQLAGRASKEALDAMFQKIDMGDLPPQAFVDTNVPDGVDAEGKPKKTTKTFFILDNIRMGKGKDALGQSVNNIVEVATHEPVHVGQFSPKAAKTFNAIFDQADDDLKMDVIRYGISKELGSGAVDDEVKRLSPSAEDDVYAADSKLNALRRWFAEGTAYLTEGNLTDTTTGAQKLARRVRDFFKAGVSGVSDIRVLAERGLQQARGPVRIIDTRERMQAPQAAEKPAEQAPAAVQPAPEAAPAPVQAAPVETAPTPAAPVAPAEEEAMPEPPEGAEPPPVEEETTAPSVQATAEAVQTSPAQSAQSVSRDVAEPKTNRPVAANSSAYLDALRNKDADTQRSIEGPFRKQKATYVEAVLSTGSAMRFPINEAYKIAKLDNVIGVNFGIMRRDERGMGPLRFMPLDSTTQAPDKAVVESASPSRGAVNEPERVAPKQAWQMTYKDLRDTLESAVDVSSLERIRPLLAEVYPEYVTVDYRDYNQDPWGIGRAIQTGTELPRIPTNRLSARHRELIQEAIRDGRDVPAEVKGEYQDIAKSAAASTVVSKEAVAPVSAPAEPEKGTQAAVEDVEQEADRKAASLDKDWYEGLAKEFGAPVKPVRGAKGSLETLSLAADMLRRAARKSKNPAQLSRILDEASNTFDESRIADDVAHNPNTDDATFEKAASNEKLLAMVGDNYVPALRKRRAELIAQAEENRRNPPPPPAPKPPKKETRPQAVARVKKAFAAGEPVPAADVDRLGVKIPDTYGREGDNYVKMAPPAKSAEAGSVMRTSTDAAPSVPAQGAKTPAEGLGGGGTGTAEGVAERARPSVGEKVTFNSNVSALKNGQLLQPHTGKVIRVPELPEVDFVVYKTPDSLWAVAEYTTGQRPGPVYGETKEVSIQRLKDNLAKYGANKIRQAISEAPVLNVFSVKSVQKPTTAKEAPDAEAVRGDEGQVREGKPRQGDAAEAGVRQGTVEGGGDLQFRRSAQEASRGEQGAVKAPELMTPEEFVRNTELRLSLDATDKLRDTGVKVPFPEELEKTLRSELRREEENRKIFHKDVVEIASIRHNPVNAAAVDAYGIKLPPGYVREGDLYVFKPEPPTPPDDGGKKPVPPAREPEAQTLQTSTPSSGVSGREAPISSKRPELMTPEEYIERALRKAQISPDETGDMVERDRAIVTGNAEEAHANLLEDMAEQHKPLNAQAVDAYFPKLDADGTYKDDRGIVREWTGYRIPKGYVREGDLYVWKPEGTPTKTEIRDVYNAVVMPTEDSLHEAGVFMSAIGGEERPGHMDSYGTVLKYDKLAAWWEKHKNDATREEWKEAAQYWRDQAYLSPNAAQLGFYVRQKIGVDPTTGEDKTPPDDGGKKPVPPAREPEAQTLQSKTPSSDVSGREAPVSAIPKGARVATTKLDSGVSYRGEFVKDNGDGTATLRAFGEKPKTGLFRRYGTDAKGVQIAKDVTVPLASVKSVEPPADLGKLTPAQRSAVRRAAKTQEAAMEAEIAAGESAGADVAGRMASAEERRERARTDNETMFRVTQDTQLQQTEGTENEQRNVADRFDLPAIALPDSIQREMQGSHREKLAEDLRGVHRQYQKDLADDGEEALAEKYSEKVQEELRQKEEGAIEDYVARNGLFIPPSSFFDKHEAYKAIVGAARSGGMENTIYVSPEDPGTIVKMNNMTRYTSWLDFLNRLAVHNFLFPETAYELVGFTRVKPAVANAPIGWNSISLRPVLKQAFVDGERAAQPADMKRAMGEKGFSETTEGSGTYTSDLYPGVVVSDLHDGNGIVAADGTVIVFDPAIQTTREFSTVNFRVAQPVTPAEDAEYMAAVEAGDMDKAQSMVDEAAKRAGYTQIAYHGGAGVNPYTGRAIQVFNVASTGRSGKERGAFFTSEKQLADDYKRAWEELQGSPGAVYRVALNLNGAEIRRNVYDAPTIRNAWNKPSDVFVVSSANQIKSADPITRDDQGNVIPLSQRFNEATPDIRFRVDQTETPEFRNWFKGSKVVDADGKPLVVYHAGKEFGSVFDVALGQMGAHFGSASQASDIEGAETTYPVFLSLQNPIRLIDPQDTWVYIDSQLGRLLTKEDKAKLEKARQDEEEALYFDDKRPEESSFDSEDEFDKAETAYIKQVHDVLRRQVYDVYRNAIQRAGYDGVVYLNRSEGVPLTEANRKPMSDKAFGAKNPTAQDSYIAFFPEQIKSAIANVGTFDPTNPDIRFRVSQPQDPEDLARAQAQFAALRALMDKPPEDFYKAKGEPDTPIVAPVVLDRKGLDEIAKATGAPLYTPAKVSQASEVRDALADYSEDFVRSAMDRINREGRPIETNDTVAKIREFERRRLQDAEVAAVEMDTAIRNGNVGRQLALLDEKEALVRDLDQAAQALSLVGSERGRQLAFLKYGLDRNLSIIYRLQKLRKASGAPVTLEQYEKMVARIARDKAEMKKLAEEHERVVAEVEKETRAKSIKEVEERMNKEVLAAYRKGAEAERSAFETILAMNDNPLGRMLDYAVARPDTADVPFRTAGERKENEFPQRLREIARAAWNATNGLGWAPFGVEFMKNAKAAGFNASVADAYLYDFARRMGVPVLAKPAEKWKPAAPKMDAGDPKKEGPAVKRRERAVKEAVRLAVAENMLADGYRIAQIASEKLVGENDFTTEWGYLTPYEIMEIVTGYPAQPEIDTRDELAKRASMVRRHMLAQLRMEELNSLKYPTKMSLPADKPDVTLRQLARELRDRMNDFQFPAGQEDERLLNAERALASRLRYAVEELQKAVDAGTPINEKAPRAVAETPEIAELRRTLKELRAAYEALPAVEAIKEARDAERARRAANKRYHFWQKRAEDAKNGIFPETSKANTTAERDAEAADYAKKAEAARREYWAIKKASPQERVRVMSEKVAKAEERLADLEAKLALPAAPDLRAPKKPEAAPASPEEAALARTLAERRAAIERVKKAISARWREENADAIAAVKEAERYQFLVAKAEMLEDRIRRGDFSKAPVRPRVWSARIAEVDRKVRGALRAINERNEWEANAAAGLGGKIQNYRVKGREVYKFFKTAGDLSAVGVQSARLFGYDPIYGTKLIWETAKNAWTDEAALAYQEEMHNDVDYDIAFEAGLALDQNYEDIFGTGMGESFVRDLERWGTGPDKGIGKRLVGGTARVGLASQRAFEMYGRMIRFHVFKSIINDPAHANMTKEQMRALANAINIAGGVGNTKFYYRDIASVMSRLMWSSRLFTAQWQTLTGGGGLLWNAGMARETSRAKLGRKWYQTAAPGALKLYSRSLAGTVALSWVFGSIGMLLLGDRQPWEDEETMFWKAFDFLFGRRVIGSKSIDTFGGLTSYTALVKRAFKGSHVTMSGKTQPDDDWKAWAQTFANFARGRLRPDISLALSAVFGEDVTGQPFGPRGGMEGMKNLAIEAAFPITPGDMQETVADMWATHGVVGVTAGLVPALASDLFGFSKGSAPRDPRYEINRHKAHLGQVRKALKEYREAPDQKKLEAYQSLASKYSFDRGVEESVAALDRAANTADKIAKDTKRPEAQRTEAAKAAKLYWEKARDILRASR